MQRNLSSLILILILPVIAGCSGMDTIRLGQDKPEDLERLLEQHEYARARQLTGRYTFLDSLEVQTRINDEEAAYEHKVISEAHELESRNDLLGAVQLLTAALKKVPHGTSLRELRNTIELKRVTQLQTNAYEQLITRARYILDQQQLYREKANLDSPSLGQRRENSRHQKEAKELSAQLGEYGQQAMQAENLELAKTCLQLSQALQQTPEVDALLSAMQTKEDASNQAAKKVSNLAHKKARIRQKKSRKKEQQDQKQKTVALLAKTRQALAENDLQVARATFVQIPSAAVTDSEVLAIQDELDQAVDVRVKKLLATGDAQYRSDNVLLAVRTWTKALSLDPDNTELRKRVERANKVLARLEELKRQQHRQPSAFTLPVKPTRVGVTRTPSR